MADPAAENIRIAVVAGVYAAPLGSTAPTDASTALDAAFINIGHILDEGVTESTSTDSTDVISGTGDIVRKIQTSHDSSVAFTMLETNEQSTGLYYGSSNVTATAAGASNGNQLAIKRNAKVLPHQMLVFDFIDGDAIRRVFVPDGQVTDRGDVVFVATDAVKYPVTVTAYPDGNGDKVLEWTDDGQATG